MSDKIDMRSRQSEHFDSGDGSVLCSRGQMYTLRVPGSMFLTSFRAPAASSGLPLKHPERVDCQCPPTSATCRTASRETWPPERCRLERLKGIQEHVATKSGQQRESRSLRIFPARLVRRALRHHIFFHIFQISTLPSPSTDEGFPSRLPMFNSCQNLLLLQKTPHLLNW